MLKDIPYSVLEQDKRAYEIMQLRDQHNNKFNDIAKEYAVSTARIVQIYDKQKLRQMNLYINHIAVVLGYENTSRVRKIVQEAFECYREQIYVCAYLEKEYKDILTEYRDGEPGMPVQFIKSMPPLKPELSEKTISRIIEKRDIEKESFIEIAKELSITQAKAKHTYQIFYHKKVLELIKGLQEKAESRAEKDAIWNYYFKGNNSPKKRYDMLTKDKSRAT